MDLGTIYSRLNSKIIYSNASEYLDDVTLMCTNSMMYNPPDTIYFQRARKLMLFAQKQLTLSSLNKWRNNMGLPGELSEEDIGTPKRNIPSPKAIKWTTSTSTRTHASTQAAMAEFNLPAPLNNLKPGSPASSVSSEMSINQPLAAANKAIENDEPTQSNIKEEEPEASAPASSKASRASTGLRFSPLQSPSCMEVDIALENDGTPVTAADSPSATIATPDDDSVNEIPTPSSNFKSTPQLKRKAPMPSSSSRSSQSKSHRQTPSRPRSTQAPARRSIRQALSIRCDSPKDLLNSSVPDRFEVESETGSSSGENCRLSSSSNSCYALNDSLNQGQSFSSATIFKSTLDLQMLDGKDNKNAKIWAEDAWSSAAPCDMSDEEITCQVKKAAEMARAKHKKPPAYVILDTSTPDKVLGSIINLPNGEKQVKPISYPTYLVRALTHDTADILPPLDEEASAALNALHQLKYEHEDAFASQLHGCLSVFSRTQLAHLLEVYGGDVQAAEYAWSLLRFVEPMGEWARRWAAGRLDRVTEGLHTALANAFQEKQKSIVSPTNPPSDDEPSSLDSEEIPWFKTAGFTLDPILASPVEKNLLDTEEGKELLKTLESEKDNIGNFLIDMKTADTNKASDSENIKTQDFGEKKEPSVLPEKINSQETEEVKVESECPSINDIKTESIVTSPKPPGNLTTNIESTQVMDVGENNEQHSCNTADAKESE